MKKMYAQKSLLMLLAALLAANTVSCGSGSTDTADPADTAGDTAAIQETEPETEARPDLPETDHEGYSFRIMGNHEQLLGYMLASETRGEVLNYAIFDANTEVMETFNIRFEPLEVDYRGIAEVENAIMAGGDDFDLAYMHNCDTAQSALSGWFLNVNELPYVNTKAVWWPKFTIDSLTVNDKIFYFTNYSSYRAAYESQVCFFNNDLLNDYNLESPYDLVWSGEWTIDKAQEMTSGAYKDVNGDGARDLGDSFGLVAFSIPYRWAESFGIEAYKKTPGSAELTLDINNERVMSIIDKLHNWFYTGSNDAWVDFNAGRDDGRAVFNAGRSLFILDTTGGSYPRSSIRTLISV